MPRWMYGLLGLAVLWLIWTKAIKPTPNVSQITTQQGVEVVALQSYEGSFRVLGREDYNLGREAELSPVDFALGWDRMADPAVYKKLSIRQSNRWYYWRYENAPPIPVNEISSQSANTHLIPATKAIAKQLAQIDQDNLIYLKGQLVEVKAQDGWTWRSSLSREDTGNGACELMLVEEVRVISKS